MSVTVALNNLSGSFIATWNVQMAGALIAATPTLVIFIVLGRYFVRGLLAGSLKGQLASSVSRSRDSLSRPGFFVAGVAGNSPGRVPPLTPSGTR
jgi:hypothetical protein